MPHSLSESAESCGRSGGGSSTIGRCVDCFWMPHASLSWLMSANTQWLVEGATPEYSCLLWLTLIRSHKVALLIFALRLFLIRFMAENTQLQMWMGWEWSKSTAKLAYGWYFQVFQPLTVPELCGSSSCSVSVLLSVQATVVVSLLSPLVIVCIGNGWPDCQSQHFHMWPNL